MSPEVLPNCARCSGRKCCEGKDCFSIAKDSAVTYSEDVTVGRLQLAAAAIEPSCKGLDRIDEIVLFAKAMGCKRIGLAFCIAVADEAKDAARYLAEHFEVVSVCCKIGGMSKESMGYDPAGTGKTMCNPVGQAQLINKYQTELNVVCGLCVGHDAIFSKVSLAPTTVLSVKNRAALKPAVDNGACIKLVENAF